MSLVQLEQKMSAPPVLTRLNLNLLRHQNENGKIVDARRGRYQLMWVRETCRRPAYIFGLNAVWVCGILQHLAFVFRHAIGMFQESRVFGLGSGAALFRTKQGR